MDLYEACENGNEERVVELLLYGENGSDEGEHVAQALGEVQQLHPVARATKSPTGILHTRGTAGRTPLLAACMGGQVGVVRLLLGESCPVYFTSRTEPQTVALLAPLITEYESFQQSLPTRVPSSGGPLFLVTMVTKDGGSDLVPMATVCLPPWRVVPPQDLLIGGRHEDDFGNTPLQCISCFGCGSTLRHVDDGLEITRMLLVRGDQPNVPKTATRWTPLHWASYNGNHELCALLLDPPRLLQQSSVRLGKTQFSIPLLTTSDDQYAVDIAGHRGFALLNEMAALREIPSEDRTQYMHWRLRLDHVQVLRVLTREFLRGAGQLAHYADEMNARMPMDLLRERKVIASPSHPSSYVKQAKKTTYTRDQRFTCSDVTRYGQHLLYWAGCFGLVAEVTALLDLKMMTTMGAVASSALVPGDSHDKAACRVKAVEVRLEPLYVCSCEQDCPQSVLHAAAAHGQHEIVSLLLRRMLLTQQQTQAANKLTTVKTHTSKTLTAQRSPRRHSTRSSAVAPSTDSNEDVSASMGGDEEEGGNQSGEDNEIDRLHVNEWLTTGWCNARNETPLFLASLFLQHEVVRVFSGLLSSQSLAWELTNANVEGATIPNIVVCPKTRHLLGLPTVTTISSLPLTDHARWTGTQRHAEYVLLFDGITKRQFKESIIETMREESALAPSLFVVRAGWQRTPSAWCGLRSASQTDYVLVGATEDVLVRHAQALQLKVKHRGSAVRSPYSTRMAHVFEPFRSLQRQQVVMDIIRKNINVTKHLRRRNLCAIFPLHHAPGCKRIMQHWVRGQTPGSGRNTAIFQPFTGNSLSQFLHEHRSHHYEMLWPLLTYFGEKHAFYYAFLMFYTVWLLLLALPGALCQLLDSLSLASYLPPLFALFVSLWATLFVERWKRKRSEIQATFGNFTRNRHEQLPTFYGDFHVDAPTTGHVDVSFPRALHLMRIYAGLPVLFAMATTVVAIFAGIKLHASSISLGGHLVPWMPPVLVPYMVPALNAVSMLLLDYLYTFVAVALTRWENHRTVWQFESMLAAKLFWFKFLNAFLSLFWVAFVDRHPGALRSQLIVIMGTRQVWYSVQRHIIPLWLVTRRWRRAGFIFIDSSMDSHLSSSSATQTRSKTKVVSVRNPWWSVFTPEWYNAKRVGDSVPATANSDHHSDQQGEEDQPPVVPATVLLQELMQPPDFLLGKQMELVLQFGYITMFVSVLPCAPLLALISNVINTRLDVICCTQIKRRPPFESETEVSTFMKILEFMSFAAVTVNCAVLFFTTQRNFESLVSVITTSYSFPAITTTETSASPKWSATALFYVNTLWVLLAVEHGVLAFKAFLAQTINDTATWVRNEADRNDSHEKQSTQADAPHSSLILHPSAQVEDQTPRELLDTVDSEALINQVLADFEREDTTNINGGGTSERKRQTGLLKRILEEKYLSAVRERDASLAREEALQQQLAECRRRLLQSTPTPERPASSSTMATNATTSEITLSLPSCAQESIQNMQRHRNRCCVICFWLTGRTNVPSHKRCLACKQFLCVDCDDILHLDDLGIREKQHLRVNVAVNSGSVPFDCDLPTITDASVINECVEPRPAKNASETINGDPVVLDEIQTLLTLHNTPQTLSSSKTAPPKPIPVKTLSTAEIETIVRRCRPSSAPLLLRYLRNRQRCQQHSSANTAQRKPLVRLLPPLDPAVSLTT